MGIPCLTVRENTERPITLTEGTNLLVGLDGRRLVEEARKVLRGKGRRGVSPSSGTAAPPPGLSRRWRTISLPNTRSPNKWMCNPSP